MHDVVRRGHVPIAEAASGPEGLSQNGSKRLRLVRGNA